METLTEMEMSLVTGGIIVHGRTGNDQYVKYCQKKWQEKEMRRLEALAQSRIQANEAAIREIMRARHAELEMEMNQDAA